MRTTHGWRGPWVPSSFPVVKAFDKAGIWFNTRSIFFDQGKGRIVRHAMVLDKISDHDCCAAGYSLLTMYKDVLARFESFFDASAGFVKV